MLTLKRITCTGKEMQVAAKRYNQPRKMKHSQDTLGDFKVKYKFRSHEDGGRQNLPHQGIRSDFWYDHEDNQENGVFMIWPLFEDEQGKLIDSGPVLKEGIARMKIVNDKMIAYHLERLKVGIKGYFMEGPHKTADCEVIELGERLKK
ncbi:MAG TPA: hypothetical protein PKD18_07545 [Saprospiraceae bacterium]|nr:hypothetical protein [Saprospiraceae bacterium]